MAYAIAKVQPTISTLPSGVDERFRVLIRKTTPRPADPRLVAPNERGYQYCPIPPDSVAGFVPLTPEQRPVASGSPEPSPEVQVLYNADAARGPVAGAIAVLLHPGAADAFPLRYVNFPIGYGTTAAQGVYTDAVMHATFGIEIGIPYTGSPSSAGALGAIFGGFFPAGADAVPSTNRSLFIATPRVAFEMPVARSGEGYTYRHVPLADGAPASYTSIFIPGQPGWLVGDETARTGGGLVQSLRRPGAHYTYLFRALLETLEADDYVLLVCARAGSIPAADADVNRVPSRYAGQYFVIGRPTTAVADDRAYTLPGTLTRADVAELSDSDMFVNDYPDCTVSGTGTPQRAVRYATSRRDAVWSLSLAAPFAMFDRDTRQLLCAGSRAGPLANQVWNDAVSQAPPQWLYYTRGVCLFNLSLLAPVELQPNQEVEGTHLTPLDVLLAANGPRLGAGWMVPLGPELLAAFTSVFGDYFFRLSRETLTLDGAVETYPDGTALAVGQPFLFAGRLYLYDATAGQVHRVSQDGQSVATVGPPVVRTQYAANVLAGGNTAQGAEVVSFVGTDTELLRVARLYADHTAATPVVAGYVFERHSLATGEGESIHGADGGGGVWSGAAIGANAWTRIRAVVSLAGVTLRQTPVPIGTERVAPPGVFVDRLFVPERPTSGDEASVEWIDATFVRAEDAADAPERPKDLVVPPWDFC